MRRTGTSAAAIVAMAALLAIPACRQQDRMQDDVQPPPAVPPQPQPSPPGMPPPAEQRTPSPREAPPPNQPSPPAAPPPAAVEPAEPSPSHAELPVLVNYTRTGGIAGISQTLIVYDNGRLEVATARGREQLQRVEHQVDPAELLALRRIFDDGEFQALSGPFVNTRGADLMTHTLRINTAQGPKRVVATDGIDWPAPLSAAIEELNRLLTLAAAAR
jgi:hypothetical protein